MAEHEITPKDKQELRSDAESTMPTRTYTPHVDIYETEAAIVLAADMPGVAPPDVTVDLHNHRLLLEGRITTNEYDGLSPLYTEFNVGPFRREFELGEEIDSGKISAKMADGVLTVTLPKAARVRPRKIEIATS